MVFIYFYKDEWDNKTNINLDGINMNVNLVKANNKIIDEVLFIICIPRINLEEKVYNIDSSKNNVDYNIEILEGSDINNNFLFLAAHSGDGKANYFNRLNELEVGDIIWIFDGNLKKFFVVDDIFYIYKNGYFEYSSFVNNNILYLITCNVDNSFEQLVIKAIMVDN